MSEPLCKFCGDEGRTVLAAYRSHPPTCAQHYKEHFAKPGTAASAQPQQNSALGALMKLRLDERRKHADYVEKLEEEQEEVADEVQETKPKEKKSMIDQETIVEIRKLAKEGKSISAIADELSVSWYVAKKYSAGSPPQNGGGRRNKKREARQGGSENFSTRESREFFERVQRATHKMERRSERRIRSAAAREKGGATRKPRFVRVSAGG